ncbi:MAG: alpha/beta fold hydrolase [Chloroflexi bacterium]|nr:alpha/beta fold hydrolase [Chloroflexota bacterium]
MDSSSPFGRWLLTYLEMMPLQMLRESAGRRLQGWLVGRLLGEQQAKELYALLNRPPSSRTRPATVLLPGLMGSLLASVEGIGALLWFDPMLVLNGHVNLLNLNDKGTADASPDVRIVPVGIEKLVYLKMIVALAQETRLYEFPYDWRRHLEWNAHLLHQAIERWSQAEPERRFVLIGHSMGGMVARTYAALYPREAERRVERLILLGSPLYGAALTTLVFRGQTLPAQIVSRLHPNNDVIGFVSNIPASYQLLPPPGEWFPACRAYPTNWDLYDARAWGLPNVRQDYLDDARNWHRLVTCADLQIPIVQIAGCHRRTLTDVWRAFDEDEEPPNLTLVYQEVGPDSGDNSVPLWSARCEAYSTYYVEEEHQLLPRNQRVIEGVLALVFGGPPDLPKELPEPSGRLAGLRRRSLTEQVAELRSRIEAGILLNEDLERLFFAH